MIKRFSLVCLSLFICSFLSAVNYSDSSWKILEQAQVQFDSGNYGEALNLCNEAINTQKNEVHSEFNILETAITPAQVKRAGTEIAKVIEVLKEREQTNAVNIINKYITLNSLEFFDNDIHNMVSWLKNKDVYPEANFLIGKIYQVEGEYPTALNFYNKAYSQREYLDIPDVCFDILYYMVFLYKTVDDIDNYEKTLLLILKDDPDFQNSLLKDSILRTVSADKEKNVNRLFMLYRAEPGFSLTALYELSELYEKRGMEKESLECSVLVTIKAFTHMLSIISERDSRYNFTDFADFLKKCGTNEEIVDWGKRNNVWESMYLFGVRAGKTGKLVFTRKYFTCLAAAIPDDYYRTLAADKIK